MYLPLIFKIVACVRKFHAVVLKEPVYLEARFNPKQTASFSLGELALPVRFQNQGLQGLPGKLRRIGTEPAGQFLGNFDRDDHVLLHSTRIPEAKQYFDQALSLNPRTNIQKELGWLHLEACNYSQAISLLTDRLQRNAADYEAFNLLLECFYRTERYEAGMQVAKLMLDEAAPSDCFENNGLLCGFLLNSTDEELVNRALTKLSSPFIGFNVEIPMQAREQLKSLLLFENYRFGLSSRKENTLTIERQGHVQELKDSVIAIGRLDENRICLPDTNVSRWHCVIVSYLDDVVAYLMSRSVSPWKARTWSISATSGGDFGDLFMSQIRIPGW